MGNLDAFEMHGKLERLEIQSHLFPAGVKEEIVAVLRGAGANKEGELCVQAIFLLLDVLKKWAEDAKGTAAFSSSGNNPQTAVKICCGQVASVSWARLGRTFEFKAVKVLTTEATGSTFIFSPGFANTPSACDGMPRICLVSIPIASSLSAGPAVIVCQPPQSTIQAEALIASQCELGSPTPYIPLIGAFHFATEGEMFITQLYRQQPQENVTSTADLHCRFHWFLPAGAAAGGSSSSNAASTAQAVHQLLSSIPQDLLAQAAAQCGAHARALLHYETHLRSKEGGGLNPVAHKNIYYSDDEVSFLQVQCCTLLSSCSCSKPAKLCSNTGKQLVDWS